jgi:hypothetical protein
MSYLTDLLNMEVGSLSIFKSDEEKEKERKQAMSQGLLESRPFVFMSAQDREIMSNDEKPLPPIYPGGPSFTRVEKPVEYPGLLEEARKEYLSMAAQPFTEKNLQQQINAEQKLKEVSIATNPIDSGAKARLAEAYNIPIKEIAETPIESTMSPLTLITLLSAFSGGSSGRPAAPTIMPTQATPGLMFQSEDPYEKYRRRGLL